MKRRRGRDTRARTLRKVGWRAACACVALGGAWLVLGGRIASLDLGTTKAPIAAELQGCSKEAPKPSSDPPIVIGVSLGLTKDLASFTLPLSRAVRAAEGEINASGGVLGRQVKFDIVDDKSDEGAGVSAVAEDFAKRGVAAVIGPVGSQQVVATQGILSQAQIIQISPSATSTDLTKIQPDDNRFLFRTTPADDFQGAAVILFATRTPKGLGDAGVPVDEAGAPVTCSRLAVVHIDNSYGNAMAEVIGKGFPNRPPKGTRSIAIDLKIPAENAKSSYVEDVNTVLAKNPQCLAIISYEKAAAQFITDLKKDTRYKALEDQGFFIIGTDGVYTSGFLEATRDQTTSYAEGVYGTNPDTAPGGNDYNAFRTIYASYFPLKATEDTPAFAANTYDAAIMIALAIQKAGSTTDRIAIRDALRAVSTPPGRPINPAEIQDALLELREGRDVDYKGASGNVDFQANGNVTSGFIVWQAAKDSTGKVDYKTVAHFDTETLQEQIK